MSTINVSLLRVSCLCYLVGLAVSSHFRGGIIQWRPVNSRAFDGNIEITHRVAWRASASGHLCNQNTIRTRNLLSGEGNLACQSGCSGSVGTMSYYCTDFSTSEDWTTGERTYIYNATGITSFEASFESCCWISTLVHGKDGNWELRVKGNLTVRSDTGSVNHSPISSTSPIVRLQHGCSHTIRIPVEDIDGDDVRCRWAESSKGECGGVCRAINATLFGCNIQYTANEKAGLYAVALQIEDFASTTATVPLSSIPLQFIIEVFNSTLPCTGKQPEMVGGTRCIEVFSTYRERIVAESGGSNIRIVDIITVSPVGLLKSNVTASTTPQQWFVDVTWTPTSSQSGPNIFCYYALDSNSLTSSRTCITLLVVQAPQVVRSSISPTGLVDPSGTHWSVQFDTQFLRPTRRRFIRIYEASTDTEVITIDVSTSSAVTYPTTNTGRTLFFSTNYNFARGATYYVLLDPGVALGTEYCGAESAAIYDPRFWTFTVVGGVVLSYEAYKASISFNGLCLKEQLVYTCITTGVLEWIVGTTVVGTYMSGQITTFVGATQTNAALPGVVANLTKIEGTLLTSTLIIPSTETFANELDIVCEGSSRIRKSLVFHQKVQQLIGLTGRNQTTTNSINITITFNLSITNNVDIRGTATPADDNSSFIVATIPGPINTPELMVPFTGLHADTNYTFAIEAVSRDNPSSCIGVGISDLLLQTGTAGDGLHSTNTLGPVMTNAVSAGAAVGTSITVFLVSFFAGALLATLIICGYTRWRGKRHFSFSEGPQPAPGHAEPTKAAAMENIYDDAL